MMRTVEMIPQVCPVTLAEYAEMPYCPVFLLDAKFDASITDHPEFPKACEWGFETYFEEMYQWDESRENLVFVTRSYTWEEVVEGVVRAALFEEMPGCVVSVASRAGGVLGWLSAHALVNRSEALLAVTVLRHLMVWPVGTSCADRAA
jgi:hypothetical protein